MELEKIADIPISGGPGKMNEDGTYSGSKVVKFRVPRKIVDILGIKKKDKNDLEIRIPLYITPPLDEAVKSRKFDLVYRFDMDKIESDDYDIDDTKEEKISSEDYGIENIINKEDEK